MTDPPTHISQAEGHPHEDLVDAEATLEGLEASLSQRQRTTTTTTPRGRAMWDSVASSLTTLRERLTPNSSDANNSTARHHGSRMENLQQRLSAVELAHSSRRPLDRVQQNRPPPPPLPISSTPRSTSASSIAVARRHHGNLDQEKEDQAFSKELHERVQKRARATTTAPNDNNSTEREERTSDDSVQKRSTRTTTDNGALQYDSEERAPPPKVLMTRSHSVPNTRSIVSILSNAPPPQQQSDKNEEKLPGSVVYSWGPSGDLTLHDDDTVRTPAQSQLDATSKLGRPGAPALVSVACGDQHTVCATASGSVYYVTSTMDKATADGNDEGQSSNTKLRQVEQLYTRQQVRQISCGFDHTAAITVDGTVLTWGSNHHGQLGHGRSGSASTSINNSMEPPQRMVLSGGKRGAMVACGHYFTLVLTHRMQVLACGASTITGTVPDQGVPTSIPTLQAMPLVFVAAGHDHAVVLTSSGTAYAWGVNEHGCCGRSYPQEFLVPIQMHLPDADSSNNTNALCSSPQSTQLTTNSVTSARKPHPFRNWNNEWQPSSDLMTQQRALGSTSISTTTTTSSDDWVMSIPDNVAIAHAACGQHHSVLVTRSGRLLVCGSNKHGQLGLPLHHKKVCAPAMPVHHPQEGCQFVSAEAGTSHTLVLDNRGDVWEMGSGSSMQCALEGKGIISISAGGDGNNVALARGSMAAQATTQQKFFGIAGESRTQMLLPASVPPLEIKNEESNDQVALRSAEYLEELVDTFAVERSGLVKIDSSIANSPELAAATEIGRRAEELLQNPAVMNSLFISPRGLDGMYEKLMAIGGGNATASQTIIAAIEKGIKKGLDSLLPENPERARMMYSEAVRCLLVYIRFFDRPSFPGEDDNGDSVFDQFDARGTLISRLMETILSLPFEGYKAFLKWATSIYTGDLFIKMLVQPLLFQLEKSCRVTVDAAQVMRTSLSIGATPLIVSVLEWLYNASKRLGIAKPKDFVCEIFDKIPIQALYHDLAKLKAARSSSKGVTRFFICDSPFLFSPKVKRKLLQVENQVEMMKAAYSNVVAFNPFTGELTLDAFFKLEIDRNDMLQQTLAAIKKAQPSDLRKSLRVKFRGEEGVDAGGVTKEFFQLLSEELFDVTSSMWTNKYGDITWFNSDCMWEDVGFELTGVLVGLALYNSVLLDVRFPITVYRKLLGYPLGLEDMVDPELKRGFQQLLDYEADDVEDIFCLSFEVAWTDDLGEEQKRELKSGGSEISVTAENKEEYVRLYISWLLVDSIYPQWASFETGVQRVLAGSSIGLCRPEEVELLVVGSPDLDFDALEANTSYEGGYDENSETIQNFWRFVKSIDLESQINFLKFATGSPKAPIGGLGELKFKIQRAGPDSPQLPTSHTCFNTLLLPDYGTEQKLSELLGRAIVECEGFGLE